MATEQLARIKYGDVPGLWRLLQPLTAYKYVLDVLQSRSLQHVPAIAKLTIPTGAMYGRGADPATAAHQINYGPIK